MKKAMKKILVLAALIISGAAASAQFSLPSMEASLKGGYSLVQGSDSDFEGIIISGSLLVHINENIAIGPFYSTGVDMNFFEFDGDVEGIENDAKQSMLGLNARFSTNRNSGLRPYLNLSYFRLELVEDFGDYRLAQKTSGFGAGIGLMIKLNRNLYLNAIEISARQIGDNIFFIDGATYILQFQTGISYNFGRSK